MNDVRRAADAEARRRALDVTGSFIVQAPAGSGKTGLLIQRFLALLAQVDAPEEIVAITFTRKAAGEMRNRVLAALDAGAADSSPTAPHERTTRELARAVCARDAEAKWDIVVNPGRLRIDTIDAFSHALVRQMPVLSRFGARPETLEDAGALYREAARRTLAALDAGGEDGMRVARILAHLDNDVATATDLVADMLARRDQWIRHVARRVPAAERRARLEAALARETCEALTRLGDLVPEELRDGIAALARYAAHNLAASGRNSPVSACAGATALPGASPGGLAAWRGIAELLLTQGGTVRRQVDTRVGFPAGKTRAEKEAAAAMKARFEAVSRAIASHRTLLEELHFTRVLPPAAYTDRQWEVVEALTGLLPLAVARLEVLFGERAQVDFTAVSQAALRALGEPGEPTDLALALDHRIRHVLVDEFQDTSLAQFELLERLTAGWEPGDGRSLFVVGDPMQSIYRFREAEVELYLRARHEGIGAIALEPLTLCVNFRSREGIVEWVNGAFSAVLPDAEDLASGAVPYVSSVAEHSAETGDAVVVHALLCMDREAEAQRVVELAADARARRADGSIALLVRSRSHLASIVPQLKAAGLKFQAIEIEELGHRPAVRDLLALTRALLHPADRIAWLALLRAPWCGLTLADLDALAGGDHRASVWTLMNDEALRSRLSDDGRRRLDSARRVLSASLARRRREPLARWIEGAWLALGGPACAEDAADVEDAMVYLRLLDELERGGDLDDFDVLAERVAALFALPDVAADPRLQVMTIHKAKGLEFDTVIVPGLGYAPRNKSARLLLWNVRPRARGASDLLLAPIREASETEDPVYRYLDALDDVKGEHENARLLYVAATRAKSRLHLIGQIAFDGKAVRPRPRSLLERLWPVVGETFSAAARLAAPRSDRAIPSGSGTAPAAPPVIRRLPADWSLPDAPASVAWKPAGQEPIERASPHERVEFSWVSESARHVGTVVHRFLQIIARDGLEQWDARRIAALRETFTGALARLGIPQAEMPQAVNRVQEALQGTLADRRGRWVLAPHPEARSELRLTGVLGDGIVSVAMDRTFVDTDGTRWIIDYKTGTHEGGDVEEFLDRERDRYRAQLERYAGLMRGLDARPLRLGLYFPLLKGWREWSA
ncbi:MAG: UvrD-helicase domain-containing protein [Betaproteobacteria bacterium]|nr:UvrD-helicase domain-containing protein [Betaproteobacteria bacterium]